MTENKSQKTSNNEEEVGVVPEHTELPDAPTEVSSKAMKLPLSSSTTGKSSSGFKGRRVIFAVLFIVCLSALAIVLILLQHDSPAN